MAKRFIDTNLFNDPWFMDLTPDAKLFYIYMITNCNQGGVIELNIRLAEYQTGIEGLAKGLETVWKDFGEKRVIHLRENYYFLPKFIRFQYPNGLNKNVKAQLSVINILNSFNIDILTLSKQLGKSLITPQDIDIYKDKDKDIIKGGVGEIESTPFNYANSDIFKSVVSYFKLSETLNPQSIMSLNSFLNILKNNNQLIEFEKQFPAYVKYKEETGEVVHGFKNFIGEGLNPGDAGWLVRNWVDALSKLNKKQSVGEGMSFRDIAKSAS